MNLSKLQVSFGTCQPNKESFKDDPQLYITKDFSLSINPPWNG